MNIALCLILRMAAIALFCQTALAEESEAGKTQWVVTAAVGMDALLLIGAASGDLMQASIYPEAIEFVRENVSADGLAALDELDVALRQELGVLTGPSLAYFFSAAPVTELEDVIASAADPVSRLRPELEKSPHWDEQQFDHAVTLMPIVHRALVALRDLGFETWYMENHAANVESGVERNLAAVTGYDVIPEQERLLGRDLDPTVEILIVNFAKPYGIRITGQRFIAYYGWDGETQLRIAAHELFHPPYQPDDLQLKALLEDLESDPWMQSIVENHDPQYGYNSFMGVINEGSTQALDQVVSERLDFAEEPGDRWRESDGGMHMFAAAVYQAMLETGFADSGGNYSDWLKGALKGGFLSPAEVRRRAAEIVGSATVDQWNPKME